MTDIAGLGIPTEAEYIANYCRRTNRDGIPSYDFYVAFNIFRLAAIMHGIRARAADGRERRALCEARVGAGREGDARMKRNILRGANRDH